MLPSFSSSISGFINDVSMCGPRLFSNTSPIRGRTTCYCIACHWILSSHSHAGQREEKGVCKALWTQRTQNSSPGKGSQVLQLSQRYEMFYYQYTYGDILDFICFPNKKTYYCNSKRNSFVFEVCYDLSKRKEIQSQRSLLPYCLSHQVTILSFTQLCQLEV